MRKFDLNIEKILENWEVYHAIRELIANALDEQILSSTQNIDIYKENNDWIIRDYGRGLRYTHLTQNENDEKLANDKVIGKFGIGLKDALATLDRQKVNVRIISKFNEITIEKVAKEGFSDITTLHAIINEEVDTNFAGTKAVLENIADDDVFKAKKLFLKFSGEEILSTTKFGEIVSKNTGISNIYINGVKVAEEQNFLFSYNITNISTLIKKALNRERTNVGRTAYADTIKKILLQTRDEKVAKMLADELTKIAYGTASDELSWIDIQEHAIKILNSTSKYLFVTQIEAMTNGSMIDQANNSGKITLIIPENLREKIRNSTDINGNPIQDISHFISDYNDSFVFDFIDERDLNNDEKKVYGYTNKIIDLFGGLPKMVRAIKISRKMRTTDFISSNETMGCWDSKTLSIVILRKQLKSLSDYSGTLIHELIHAETGLEDVNREFETALTTYIGKFMGLYLNEFGKKNTRFSWF